jgi:hypothetical protein
MDGIGGHNFRTFRSCGGPMLGEPHSAPYWRIVPLNTGPQGGSTEAHTLGGSASNSQSVLLWAATSICSFSMVMVVAT